MLIIRRPVDITSRFCGDSNRLFFIESLPKQVFQAKLEPRYRYQPTRTFICNKFGLIRGFAEMYLDNFFSLAVGQVIISVWGKNLHIWRKMRKINRICLIEHISVFSVPVLHCYHDI